MKQRINLGSPPALPMKGECDSASSRRALAQPRFLLAAMALAIVTSGATYLATAQTGKTPVKMTASSSSTLSKLPAMVEAYGQARAQATSKKAAFALPKGASAAAVGTGASGFNLVETDLTANTASDERESAVSPSGEFITFASDRVVAANGTITRGSYYHIWLMSRDGTNVTQLTGFGADATRQQRRPSWSPDGNQIVYIDGSGTATQLYIVQPFVDGDTTTPGVQPTPRQRTFVAGNKQAPTWSPSGLSIAFATNADPINGTALNSYDIYSISPTGSNSTIVRITGGSNDAIGNNTDDLNPAYSLVNQNVIFFSSNRDQSTTTDSTTTISGRRIWSVDGSATAAPRQITEPSKRPADAGRTDPVIDDFPAPSLNVSGEKLAFQTNSYLDSSDAGAQGSADFNIWALPVNSNSLASTVSTTQEPLAYVSSFGSDEVVPVNTKTQNPSSTVPTIGPDQGLGSPEGIALTTGEKYYLVSNRANGHVDRYDAVSGEVVPGANFGTTYTTPGDIPEPTNFAISGGYLYVASGGSHTAVYRFTYSDSAYSGGVAAPADAKSTDAAFTSGEPDLDQDKKPDFLRCESVAVHGDFLYVTVYNEDRINVYNIDTGVYVRTLDITDNSTNPATPVKIDGPTGLIFIDSNRLLISSSGTDQVLLVNVDKDDASTGGRLVRYVVDDSDGSVTNLNAPEGLYYRPFDTDANGLNFNAVYVSSVLNSDGSAGDHINRYDISGTNASKPRDAARTDAVWLQSSALNEPGYFTFNSAAFYTPPTTSTTTPIETSGSALVVTNILSSPNNYSQSGLSVGQDKAADIEAAYSRLTTSVKLASRLFFSSARRFEQTATKPLSNPYGDKGDGSAFTHDIWSTSTLDTTPPVLIPQGAGNVTFPTAPVPNDTSLDPSQALGKTLFPSPRTFEEGVQPNAKATDTTQNDTLRLAVVLSELESGLDDSSVTATYYRAGSENFTSRITNVNLSQPTKVAVEGKASPVAGFEGLPFKVYDDGPPNANGTGGHELQANAVKGDGIYYCYANLPTPNASADFYIDISVTDRQGNSFNYDNIWGFSTVAFKSTLGNDLFVSDYTCGQQFPFRLTTSTTGATTDTRFALMDPVESYYLNNPGGIPTDAAGNDVDAKGSSIGGRASVRTLPSVDIWRVLCRGSIPSAILDAYRPSIALQIDPNDKTTDPAQRYRAKTREVAVSKSCVIWASPYAQFTFAGPGTIVDPVIQTRLTAFLQAGGRLWLTGRDILYGLTSGGTQSNTFLKSELLANYGGETRTTVIDSNGLFSGDLEIPLRTPPGLKSGYDDPTASYADASLNQSYYSPYASAQMDIISPLSATDAKVSSAYTVGGDVVGQSIVRKRAGTTIESRLVLMGFGFEAVNRGITFIDKIPYSRDDRLRTASSIRLSFKTTSVSGTVVNDLTNAPIPDFLVEVSNGPDIFYARTDANGQYTVTGLPTRTTYFATPVYQDGVTPNNGYFGGQTASGFNLRPIPIVPGSLSGTAVLGTSPKTPAVNVAVLIKSTTNISTGGIFSRLTTTDADGDFSFTDVPSKVGNTSVNYQVIFNPLKSDIPSGSGISYSGPNTTIGRRIVPDNHRPADIVISPGNNYFLNDPDPVKYPNLDDAPTAADNDTESDSGVPIVIPTGPSIYGTVTFGGKPVPNSVVQLLDNTGKVLRTQTTPTSGNYSFSDVKASSTANTTYKVHATGSVLDGVTASNTVVVTVPAQKNGIVDIRQDIPLSLASITGKVTYNGAAISGISIQLLNSDGTAFAPKRATSTDSTGSYTLKNVPAGTYIVKATRGSVSGQANVTVAEANTATNPAKAPTINLFIASVSGKVTYNGKATSGILVQLLNSDGTALSPARSTKTDSSGAYTFATVGSGSYLVKATLGSATGQAKITVSGTKNTTVPTINLYVLQISGKVTYNGAPASGALVQLLNRDGTVVSTTRSVKTNSSGSYVLTNVLPGSYIVRATQGSGAGQVAVTVTDRNVTAPTIALLTHQLTGSVVLKVDGASKGTPLKGAVVELLTSSGASFNPAVTVTSDSAGMYTFDNVDAGQYKLRAAYMGDVTVSSTFTMKSSQTTGPTLTLYLQNLTVRVINSSNVAQSGASVELRLNGSTVQTGTTKSNGQYTFTNVSAASPSTTYTIVAVKGSSSGNTTVAVYRGKKQNVATVQLTDPTSPSTPTTFDTMNRVYALSIPYEDMNYPGSSNVSEKTGTTPAATTKVKNAFTVPPFDPKTGDQNYVLQRFDPTTLSYVDLDNDDTIVRGVGYLLQVVSKGTSLKLPSSDSTRVPLRDPNTEKLFTVTLHYAASLQGNDANGRNLIGFGFDPAQFSGVDWETAKVTHPNGQSVESIDAAVQKGWLSGQITTLQGNGSSSASVEVSDLHPYGGYYVQTYVDGLKITFRNPTPQ